MTNEILTMADRGFTVGTVVRHFKGKFYRIEGVARHTESAERLVIYRQLYAPYGLYARPEAMFCSEVDHDKYPDAAQLYRMEDVSLDALGQPFWRGSKGSKKGGKRV